MMKYHICQLAGSEIYSGCSYISAPDGDRTLLNPYNSSSEEWGRAGYDISESIEKEYSDDIVHIIWGVNNEGGMSTYTFRNRYEPSDDDIIFGLSPQGEIAIWSSNERRQKLLSWEKVSELSNKRSSRAGYSRLMTQYTYRYVVEFNSWNEEAHEWNPTEMEFDMNSLQEDLFDGTFDKENNGNLFKLHKAGVPHRIRLIWKLAKSEYSAYFFFEPDTFMVFFEKFYGIHPDTETDFIIKMDPCKRKYEPSLYRYGLRSPVMINEDCFQLIVFKNGFENYKSDRYNQANGAWIW